MTIPLLSVVIPTHNRPQFLPRAIESALQAAPDGDVEVIVVPNGPDESWKAVAASFKHEQRVQWHPIVKAHANAARNEGKRYAQSKYLWFLDDDDYLLEGATSLIALAEKESLEIASAPVDLVAHDGGFIKRLNLASTDDFVSSCLSPQRQTGFSFHIYLHLSIHDFWLDERVGIGQDTHWVHYLCQLRDWRWGKINASGYAWRQHSSPQISAAYGPSEHLKLQERLLWETIESLIRSHRLTDQRAHFAAQGMWSLVHAGFFMNPQHWYPVMKKVQQRFPGTYPEVAIYNKPLGRFIPPLALETLMLPKRWHNHLSRQRLVKQGVKNAWEF
ncbi:glycosyltransferase family 2 protein [Lampropedia puyangensis]|uniref:Glycosyltransferase family 2 protein n=1 Tax=Lampropedia puyangensis TaxID=1330072 RepID=A0A4S8F7X6_9BURK|nr:glycosyltransferase family 2 protein [Lampropedia puyangensis]THU03713.1 glycosyltransferase family 2 protein [Lampropedia puyangensis]